MDVIRKDATITNTDDAFPGTFQVVLSAPTKDRDGETLLAEEWKQPLPDHITFDIDHEMSVRGTVGSGRPWIDHDNTLGGGKGALIVDGTYSSLAHAQDTRTLVKEGHINRTSVAFMSEKTQKDGKSTVVRELLNGAFVAIPANREAVILSSKGVKAGARNSKQDQEHLDEIARRAIALGANVHIGSATSGGDTNSNEDVAAAKQYRGSLTKSIAGSLEAAQDRVRDALQDANPDAYVYLRGTVPDGNGGGYVVFAVEPNDGPWTDDLYQQAYTDSGSVVTLAGDPKPVDLTEVVTSDPDEDADTAAPATSPAAAKAATGEATGVTVEDHSIDPLVAARKRFYATLTGRN